MKQNRFKWLLISLVVLLLMGVAVWWNVFQDGDSRPEVQETKVHREIPHRPEGVKQPQTRAASKLSMKEVRRDLYAAMRRQGFKPKSPIFIRIFKHSRALEVFMHRGKSYELFRTYRICTFSGELGPKLRRGDYQAPEGFYRVTRRQLNPNSSYYLAFNVGYPNAYDRAHGRTGSSIMVHGKCVSAGCFAMTDSKITEIFAIAEDALKAGQRAFSVHIFPFRMTVLNHKRLDNPRWRAFWAELQPGYDAFERTGLPPKIRVRGGRYEVQAVKVREVVR